MAHLHRKPFTRRRAIVSAAAFTALASASCFHDAEKDLDTLSAHLRLPAGTVSARWRICTLPVNEFLSLPGPTFFVALIAKLQMSTPDRALDALAFLPAGLHGPTPHPGTRFYPAWLSEREVGELRSALEGTSPTKPADISALCRKKHQAAVAIALGDTVLTYIVYFAGN
ncbi:hypothetical protein OOT46_09275 [Aquabacterium sp. A7-Y]|uniref:hypothetical protein n=1 Tax=Aquabacterium sp. A7-Y TaxID=1349605 RepID=UPI00223CD62F|nr:hypothetical protein [Aquabacterium sp. A7-Y]MCW7538037.1 hypothetical protein [Aquabacterium sp. A7-Y]